MPVAPAPATNRFLERWREAALSATVGRRTASHSGILDRASRGALTIEPRQSAGRPYYEHGIDTILAMHIDDREGEQLQLARAKRVITGHVPSHSISINRLTDALEQRGLEVIAGFGVIRQ